MKQNYCIFFSLFIPVLLFAQDPYIDSLKGKLTRPQDTLYVQTLIQLTAEYERIDPKIAKLYAHQAMDLSEKLNYQRGIAKSHYHLGVISVDEQELEKSKEELDLAAALFKKLGMKQMESNTYSFLGTVAMYEADYNKSISYFLTRLKMEEELNNAQGIFMSYNNLGSVYSYIKNYDKSIEYFLKCIPFLEKTNSSGVGDVYSNIGNLYSIKHKDAIAIEYYDKAIEAKKKDKNKIGFASIYNNKGEANFNLENYTEALINFREALRIAEETSDKRNQAGAYTHMGNIYSILKQYNNAIEHYEKSLVIAKQNNFRKEIKNNYMDIADVYSAMNNYRSAFHYHVLYSNISDSILSLESSEQINELNALYETEKKDKDLIKKDAEIEKQLINAKQKSQQRDFFIAGFAFMILLAFLAFRSYRLKRKANKEISMQKEIIQEKNNEIIDSINYAKRIQYTLLANENLLKRNLHQYFVLFKPKDIVSGDFYWAAEKENKFYIAVCDSTGHGVPGAFMSLLNISFLNEAINEKKIIEPHEIFNYIRIRLIENISQDGAQDGMDAVLLCIDKITKNITYASANNSILHVSSNQIISLPADKMPIGKGEKNEPFKLFNLKLNTNEVAYLYTDGYADQFGGPKGKKFKYKQLNDLLLSIAAKPLAQQKNILNDTFENWRGKLEQVDDVCIIGIKL